MKKSKRPRNTAFLIELLVNVFVLCISCAILIGVFTEASLTVRGTNRANAAGNEINAVLQTAKLRGLDAINAEPQPDGTLVLGYDKAWSPADTGSALFLLTLTVEEEQYELGVLQSVTAVATATDQTEEICRFSTAFYRPEEGRTLQ